MTCLYIPMVSYCSSVSQILSRVLDVQKPVAMLRVTFAASGDEVLVLNSDLFDEIMMNEYHCRSVFALKKHLSIQTGHSRFRQRILKGSEGALYDGEEITAPLDLQLVILDFCPPDDNADAEFIDACTHDHVEIVEAMLQRPQNPDTRDPDGWPALHFAAEAGNTSCVELLLESRADLEMRAAEDGSTALHCAASNGHVKVLKLLLHCGADKDCALTNGCTPLRCASSNGHLNVVRLLLRANAEKNSVRPDGATPLHVAAHAGHLEVVRLLQDSGAEKNTATREGETPLHVAAHAGHLEVVRLLLDFGAEKNTATREGETPLHVAAHAGHLEVVRLLLDSGAEKNTATREGITPLYGATYAGHLEVVRLLLDSGAEKNTATREGETPLHGATYAGHLEVVRLLLDSGLVLRKTLQQEKASRLCMVQLMPATWKWCDCCWILVLRGMLWIEMGPQFFSVVC